jgi:hypothetical protein
MPVPVTCFDVKDARHLLAAVMESVSHSVSTLSAVAGRRSRAPPRPFTLCVDVPDWSGMAPAAADILSYDLPTSVAAIKRFADLKVVIKRGFVKVAPQPFAHGAVRLAYHGLQVRVCLPVSV